MVRWSIDRSVFASDQVDRTEDLRDPARLAAQWPSARLLIMAGTGSLPIVRSPGDAELAYVDAATVSDAPLSGAVMVGRQDGRDHWAITREALAACGDTRPAGESPRGSGYDASRDIADVPKGLAAAEWRSIREIGALLPAADATAAMTAAALLSWHARAPYCARCGMPSAATMSGHSRRCTEGHEEFPRTDPAVIVAVHDGEDRLVLARNAAWPARRFSVLAGFVEAGEALEATVAREIGEEIGVAVDGVEYLGSQPWPFPRSLMVAFAARAPRDAALSPRAGEIAEARWFSAAELRTLLDRADEQRADEQRADEQITLPGRLSIARRMIEAFARSGGHVVGDV